VFVSQEGVKMRCDVIMRNIYKKIAILSIATITALTIDLTEPPPLYAQEAKAVVLPETGITVTSYGTVMVKPAKAQLNFRQPFFTTQQELDTWEEKVEKAVGNLGYLTSGNLANIEIKNFADAVKKLEETGAIVNEVTFSTSDASLKEATLKAKRLASQEGMEEANFWKDTLKGQFTRMSISSVFYSVVSYGTIRQVKRDSSALGGGGFGGGMGGGSIPMSGLGSSSENRPVKFLTVPKELTVTVYVALKYKIE
jgi:hypothetical protein